MSQHRIAHRRRRQRAERKRQRIAQSWDAAYAAEMQRTGLARRDIPVWIDGDGRLRVGGDPRCPVDGNPCDCPNQMGCNGREGHGTRTAVVMTPEGIVYERSVYDPQLCMWVTENVPAAVTVNGKPASGPLRWNAGDPMEIRIESQPMCDSMTLFHNGVPLPPYDSPIADMWQWGPRSESIGTRQIDDIPLVFLDDREVSDG